MSEASGKNSDEANVLNKTEKENKKKKKRPKVVVYKSCDKCNWRAPLIIIIIYYQIIYKLSSKCLAIINANLGQLK